MVIDPETDLYEGIFYCVKCGSPIHCVRVLVFRESCDNCGGAGFISMRDFDIGKVVQEVMEKWPVK